MGFVMTVSSVRVPAPRESSMDRAFRRAAPPVRGAGPRAGVDLGPLSRRPRSGRMEPMDRKAGPWRLTGYALAQLALFVPTIVVFVLVVVGAALAIVTVGIPILLVSVPGLRWLADRHRSMAAEVPGPPRCRRRTCPTDGQSPDAPPADLGARPDDLARPGLAAGRAHRSGFALSLLVVLLLVARRHRRRSGGSASRRSCGRAAAIDRWFLSSGHDRDASSSGSQALTETRAESRRPLGRRAAPDRARPARRRPGPAGRARDDASGWPRSCSSRDPDGARAAARARPAATTGAALGDLRVVVRGIHPPVLADRGLAGAVEALALDLAVPGRR